MAAGNFTASTMKPILARLNEMWLDPATKRDYISPIDSFKAIADNQQLRLNPIIVGGDCRGYEVTWLKPGCDNEATDIDSEDDFCEIDGTELESVKKVYDVTNAVTTDFKVWDDDCKDTFTFQDKVAEGMYQAEIALEKKLNTASILFLNASIDDNTHVVGNAENVAGAGTYFPAADWTPELMGQLAEILAVNKVAAPILLTGTNMWNAHFNASYNALNTTGKDQMGKLMHFPNWYFDPLTLDGALSEKATFGFDPGVVGFLNKNFWANRSPINTLDKNNTHIWSFPARNLKYKDGSSMKPVIIDAMWQRVCKTTSGRPVWGTIYKFFLRYEMVTSPADCNSQLGIFKFVNGTTTP
jgi:hypothetical protein